MSPHPARREWAQEAAFWIWTLGQAAILAVYAGRVRLSGGYPQPVEMTADLGLACGQLVLHVLFASTLLHFDRRIGRFVAVGVVMTVVAAKLADRSASQTLQLATVVGLWIAVFALLAHSRPALLMLIFLTIAAPVLFYASAEYTTRSLYLGDWRTLLSPTLGVCATRLHNNLWRPAIVPTLAVLAALIAAIFGKRRRSFPLRSL